MSTTETYNGWRNYETWNVNLWLSNDEGTWDRCLEMAREAWDESQSNTYLTRKESAQRYLADCLKGWVEDEDPLAGTCSMYADLLGAALSEVDWWEIAEGLLEEYEE